jgi:RNA polymerase sigma factor (sigma-70 family)
MLTKKQTQLNSENLTIAHHDYNKGLNAYAFFKLHNSATGEDLVQETFTKTWAYLVRGGNIVTMKAFLYHILNNLIVDEYRKQKHEMRSLDTLIENGFEPKDEQSKNLIDFLDGKEAMHHIAKLTDKYKKVMHMRFKQSMSLREISTIMGQTKNTTAVQIHRGIDKLKILCVPKILLQVSI